MPLQSTLRSEGKGLCLLSLDAGGARGISQLKILGEVMHQLNFEVEEDHKLLPCDVFDMIGGIGSGGFIAILLVVFGLNVEQTMDEFAGLSVNILEKQGMEPPARTAALRVYINMLLERYNFERGLRLLDSNIRSKGSKIVIPILYKRHIEHALILRNFEASQQEALNFTIAEAMLATLASPALFTPLSIVNDASTLEYISGDFKLSNPTRTIVSEAYEAVGGEARIACLLSIGCGHSGIISAPDSSDATTWNQFLEKAVMDSEQTADEIESQMGHLGLYKRFSVTRGLEGEFSINTSDIGDTIAHTTVYLAGVAVSQKMDLCAESLRLRDGVASLDQLKHSGGQSVLPPAFPLPTRAFVMRKAPWDFIEKVMLGLEDFEEGDGPRMLVVTGMGGCGKTQLMLKFMQVHKNKFSATFFIDGSSVPRIRADTIRHVRSLSIAHSQMGFEDCLLFLARPSTAGSRVILYDNVDDPDIDLGPLLPLGESCEIVVTSRNRSLGQLSPDAHLELDVMSMDEAVDLLLRHAPVTTDQMRQEAGAVAQVLGFLPIALTQARSYMFQTQCSAREYLERLSISRDKLLAQPVKPQRDMRYLSTYAALNASFELLTIRCQHLLRLLSYFHWADFPLELVILAAKHSFSDYRTTYIEHGEEYYTGRAMLEAIFVHEGKWDITELDEMIVLLRNHSLITLTAGTGTQLVQIHPVAHGWVNSGIPEQERAHYQSAAILLLALGSRNEYTTPEKYLASHVTHMSSLWDKLHLNNTEAFAEILDRGGLYGDALRLREEVVAQIRSQAMPKQIKIAESNLSLAMSYYHLGRYNDAETLVRESLRLKTEILGKRHPDTIGVSSNLAAIHYRLGRLKEAGALWGEVLVLCKEILGERHPDTISASHNLATTYSGLGRLKEAEALRWEVLVLCKEILGERHPDTISAFDNLAATYAHLGRLKEAEALQENVLRLSKEILGERHPDTISASNNLATTYARLGRLKEAEALRKEVLVLRKEILGERHPDTISASNNLASTYYDLGRLKEAEALQENDLLLRKEILGERHPDTISASNNLTATYSGLGRLKEAEALQQHVLLLRKEILGERHPDTITASSNLAATYCRQGRLKEAEALWGEVLVLRKEILGERHPDTISASHDLATTYSGLGRLKEAEALRKQVLVLRKEILGERHPDTISASNNLATTYYSLGRLKEAEALQENVLLLRKEILGKQHPDTASASSNLAITYRGTGELDKAVVLLEEMLAIRKETLGERHPDTLLASNNLADCYLLSGRLENAEALQVETLRQAQEILGNEHPSIALYMFTLAEIYESLRRKMEALQIVEQLELIYAEKVGTEHRDYLDCLELRTRLRALPDAPPPVTTLDPSHHQPNAREGPDF